MYQVLEGIPDVLSYIRLRKVCGLSPRSEEAAVRGLPNTLFSVIVRTDDEIVGMGRVVGDGGCNYEIVDIAVDPDHQGEGLGTLIMQEIMSYIHSQVPPGAYISMIADVPDFYSRFGFSRCSPQSEGMYLKT
jgi:predicted N-acetyltransferase YhbS